MTPGQGALSTEVGTISFLLENKDVLQRAEAFLGLLAALYHLVPLLLERQVKDFFCHILVFLWIYNYLAAVEKKELSYDNYIIRLDYCYFWMCVLYIHICGVVLLRYCRSNSFHNLTL